mmetsp:Transcript_43843/g.109076  ORF Transcript_43843/g.109076 Transcript_43843/m.109076 type:complete len:233 (-) Transcript_43843:71-769(-)
MRRLIEHTRAPLVRDLPHLLAPRSASAGDEAEESKLPRVERADGERGSRRARAGHGHKRVAMRYALRGDLQPRVRDAGRARVGDERDRLICRKRREQQRDGACGIVFVVGDDPLSADAQVAEQRGGHAGVFARDHVRLTQRADRSQRQVLQVADRGGDDVQRPAEEWHVAGRSAVQLPRRLVEHKAQLLTRRRSFIRSSFLRVPGRSAAHGGGSQTTRRRCSDEESCRRAVP